MKCVLENNEIFKKIVIGNNINYRNRTIKHNTCLYCYHAIKSTNITCVVRITTTLLNLSAVLWNLWKGEYANLRRCYVSFFI